MTLIKDDDDLLGTVNSHIKPPLKRRKTEVADSRYAKASRGRTKKDKDLEDSDTSSDNEGQSLCKSRDSNRTLHSRRNKRTIKLPTEVQNARAESNATEHNAVNDNDKLCPTKGERTFYCAYKRSPSFNAEPQQAATIMTS
ncbi:hypothetical protein HBH46_117680 [Parastagonospora nodorum]|nr:hypothetical protein HBH46_117680 [Parastagonospora nodorum]